MKWIKVSQKRPLPYQDILFTDGKRWYKGWLETCQPDEYLSFYNEKKGFGDQWPDNITHWMKAPTLPRENNETIRRAGE